MAARFAVVYHSRMDGIRDILAQNRPMSATDWVVDVVIAAGVFGFGCLQLSLAVNMLVPDEAIRRMLGIDAVVPTPFAVMAVFLVALPLVMRRRFPWPAFAASVALWVFFQMLMTSVSLSLVGPLVTLFTLGVERSRNETVIAALFIAMLLLIMPQIGTSSVLSSISLVQNLAMTAAVGFAGYAMHAHRDFLRAAEERASQAELTRESEAQRRVEEERVRIAREVHDITAHSLSAVSIQAAAAERLIDRDPAAAKEAIATVRATAKTSLEEIRAMIGVLRSGDAAAETAPTEGTDRMGDLVSYLKSAGVACAFDESGYRRADVPAFIDVALYGIAREACTNIVRHANAARAAITLSLRTDSQGKPTAARLVVSDDGCGIEAAASYAGGHGLSGMRERARLLKGSFDVRNAPEGGLVVSVDIPLFSQVNAERGEQL